MKQKNIPVEVFLVITSIISIVVGVICLAYPNKISELVVIIVGAALITYGIVELFSFFTYKMNSMLVLSVIVMLAGIVCFIRPAVILSIMGVFLGLFLTLQGVLTIKNTIVLKKSGFGLWWLWLIVSFIIVIIGITGIFNPSSIYGVFAVVLGFGFLINGISNLSLLVLGKRFL